MTSKKALILSGSMLGAGGIVPGAAVAATLTLDPFRLSRAKPERAMDRKRVALTALLFGVLGFFPAGAQADVIYQVFNPAAPPFPFVLFVYDSPGFITTDTTVSSAQLSFINPLNTITDVDFIPASASMPGKAELDVFETNTPTEQVRYYPSGTFDVVGVTAGLPGSAGYPNSMLSVAVPEPSSLGLLGVGVIGLLACWSRARGRPRQG